MTNEVKNEPELRFPEFEDAWKIKKLIDLGEYNKSYSFSRAIEGEGYIHHIHYGDIHSKLPSKIDKINLLPTITENRDFNFLQKGDIVFADASEDYKDLGKAVLFDINGENVIAGLHTHAFRVNNQVVSEFLINYTKTLAYYKFIKKQGTGISVLGISKKNLSNFNLGLPEYNEQKKIGDFFSKLDRQIELEEEKLELLEQQKKGYMQQIFSQELRFKDDKGNNYPEWEEKLISDIGKVVTGNTPSKKENEYWNSNQYVWVTPTDISNKKNISTSAYHLSQKGFEKARKLPKNTLLITCIASIGKNAILRIEGACNQQINAVIPTIMMLITYITLSKKYLS